MEFRDTILIILLIIVDITFIVMGGLFLYGHFGLTITAIAIAIYGVLFWYSEKLYNLE